MGNRPLWNFSSIGGTSCFTLAIMAFVEVVMSGMDESDWVGGDIRQLDASWKNAEDQTG